MMTTVQSIGEIFGAHSGIMRTKELNANGIYYQLLQRLMQKGYVEKIRYGYYQWQDHRASSEASAIIKLFPDATLCMHTALQYYGYTDRTPAAWCLAVDRNSTKTRFDIDYPSVKPYYLKTELLPIGESSGIIDEIEVKIYDRERTICDCLRQMNKMDVEIFSKAVQGYIKDPQKNIARLMNYAQKLRVERKVRTIMGVWL